MSNDIQNPGKVLLIIIALFVAGTAIAVYAVGREPAHVREALREERERLQANAGKHEAEQREHAAIRASDAVTISALKARLKIEFSRDAAVEIGDMPRGRAVVIGDGWAYHVRGTLICAGNGTGRSSLHDGEYCDKDTDYNTLKAAVSRTYRWDDF